ncbi:MAG: hypothetical protein H0U78_03615 [Rickettsiaceae bacterium]|nr:hypothetical protein [Rickettsiaceae bacterium]
MSKARVIRSLSSLMTSVSEENVNAKDSNGWAPIHYMAGSGELKQIEYLVRSLGADLNLYTTEAGDNKPITPFIVAIKNGEVAAADLLLKLGASSVVEIEDLSLWIYGTRHKTSAAEWTSTMIHKRADIYQLRGIIEKYDADEVLSKYISSNSVEGSYNVEKENAGKKKEDVEELMSRTNNLFARDEEIVDPVVVIGELPQDLSVQV